MENPEPQLDTYRVKAHAREVLEGNVPDGNYLIELTQADGSSVLHRLSAEEIKVILSVCGPGSKFAHTLANAVAEQVIEE